MSYYTVRDSSVLFITALKNIFYSLYRVIKYCTNSVNYQDDYTPVPGVSIPHSANV